MDDYIEVQRDVLKTEKKAVVAETMQFTDAVSTVSGRCITNTMRKCTF
jgi:hypothetical protein